MLVCAVGGLGGVYVCVCVVKFCVLCAYVCSTLMCVESLRDFCANACCIMFAFWTGQSVKQVLGRECIYS